MDLQESSAPLMRQLESTERQNRARAAAWADLEAKLRSNLEENIVQNEQLTKQKNEIESELKKTSRVLQAKESELQQSNLTIDDLNESLTELSSKHREVLNELKNLKVEFEGLERLMKGKESRYRTEMMNSINESEERYNDRIESLEVDLRQERDKRESLENNIKEMMKSAPEALNGTFAKAAKSPNRNLGNKANQADILQDTLFGLGDGDDEGEVGDDGEASDDPVPSASGSFAFIEQLSQALKASKLERDTLRKQLDDSEERRGVLENDSVKGKEAVESLPVLEAKVAELTRQVAEKDMEITALQEDIFEVRQMYRSQLDALFLEKVSGGVPQKAKPKPIPPTSTNGFGGMRTF